MLHFHNEMFYLIHYRNNAAGAAVIVDMPAVTLVTLREAARSAASAPDAAFLLLACGALAVLLEFIRPGLVAPGVLGAFSLLLGTWAFVARGASLSRVHPATALAAGIPVTAAAAILLYYAYIARRNKTEIGSDKPAATRLR